MAAQFICLWPGTVTMVYLMCTCSCYFIHLLWNSSSAAFFGLCPTDTWSHEAFVSGPDCRVICSVTTGPVSELFKCLVKIQKRQSCEAKKMTYFLEGICDWSFFFSEVWYIDIRCPCITWEGTPAADSNSTDSVLKTSIVALQKQEVHTVLCVC